MTKLKNKIKKYFNAFLVFLASKNMIFIEDKKYLELMHRVKLNKELNLDKPYTFNEKMQWLKINDRKNIYTIMVDKYEVKNYVANIIGKQYIIPTLGIYKKIDEIDFDNLPNQFVIKCTHDSGGLVICKDKKKFNKSKSINIIKKSLKRNFFFKYREWPYKNVEPRIIIEKYMVDKNKENLTDYKFFCFNGEPKFMYVSEGLENHETAKMDFVDMNYKKTEFYRTDFSRFETLPTKPLNFEKMKELSRILSKGRAFLRVDFYELNGKIYFSELTFYPNAGYMPIFPEKYDEILGKMLQLPTDKQHKKDKQ